MATVYFKRDAFEMDEHLLSSFLAEPEDIARSLEATPLVLPFISPQAKWTLTAKRSFAVVRRVRPSHRQALLSKRHPNGVPFFVLLPPEGARSFNGQAFLQAKRLLPKPLCKRFCGGVGALLSKAPPHNP